IPALEKLYREREVGKSLRCLRDTQRWRYLLTYIPHCLVYAPEGTALQGYLLYDYQAVRRSDAASEQGMAAERNKLPNLRLLEMVPATWEARRGLLGYLSQQAQAESIEYLTDRTGVLECGLMQPVLEPSPDAQGRIEIVPTLMLRIVDLAKTVT